MCCSRADAVGRSSRRSTMALGVDDEHQRASRSAWIRSAAGGPPDGRAPPDALEHLRGGGCVGESRQLVEDEVGHGSSLASRPRLQRPVKLVGHVADLDHLHARNIQTCAQHWDVAPRGLGGAVCDGKAPSMIPRTFRRLCSHGQPESRSQDGGVLRRLCDEPRRDARLDVRVLRRGQRRLEPAGARRGRDPRDGPAKLRDHGPALAGVGGPGGDIHEREAQGGVSRTACSARSGGRPRSSAATSAPRSPS